MRIPIHLVRAIALVLVLPVLASAEGPPAEWPAYGNDPGGTRYSPLADITRENVKNLRVAWTYRTKDNAEGFAAAAKRAFEATPVMVEGTLYLSTPTNRIVALDAETGAERWVFDPKIDPKRNYSEMTSRGVSVWVDAKAKPGAPGRRRIFAGTLDARLIALDAATGAPCADFGARGQVDLTRGIEFKDVGNYQVTSPPAVCGDVVVVGSSIGDNRRADLERGVVRAYDARTGAPRWSWDPIPVSKGSRERLGGHLGGSGARTRVRADEQSEPRLLRWRAQGREPLLELGRRAPRVGRKGRVGVPGRPP
jgi:quinoprotein glucose dehydrogenase